MSKKEKSKDQLSEAFNFFEQGKMDQALEKAKKALENDPNNFDAAKFISFIYFNLKKYEDALNYTDVALKIDTQNANLYQLRGIIFKAIERYDEAIDELNKSLEIDPNNCDTLTLKGNCYNLLKEYENAIRCFDIALSINKNYGLALRNKFDSLKSLGRDNEVKELEKKFTLLNTGDINELVNKAKNFLKEGKFVDTLKCYHLILKLQPTLESVKTEINLIINSLENTLNNLGITKFIFPKWEERCKFFDLGMIDEDSLGDLNVRYATILEIHQIDEKNANMSNFKGHAIMMIKDYDESIESLQGKTPNLENTSDRLKHIEKIEIPSWRNKNILFYSLGDISDLTIEGALESIGLFLNLNKIYSKARMIPLRSKDMILCIDLTPGAFEEFQKAFNIDSKHVITIGQSKRQINEELLNKGNKKQCVKCKAINPSKNKFCTKCGNKL